MAGSLSPQQLQIARMVYGIARSNGLSDAQAKEVVAASYAESGLNPRATNKSSGAAGLFQLLSPGYRQSAQKLGGLYDPAANTKAIIGSYRQFFASHPHAPPGLAGAQVERSGEGAGFYSSPLALFGSLSGSGGATSLPQAPQMSQQQAPAASSPAMLEAMLASLQATGRGQPLNLSGFLNAARGAQAAPQDAPGPATPNHGQRSHSSGSPIRYSQVIGLPFQGSHSRSMNSNWQSENAVDLAAPVGTPVYAVASGVIGPNIGSQGKGGRFAGLRVEVDAPENAYWYGHLSRLVVQSGQRVKKGQLLGYSGEANGVPHLHFASRRGDPRNYVG